MCAMEIAGGSYWELEKDIGKLVENMVIGSEDLITRVQEMMALYDISVIHQDELEDIRLEFVQKVGTSEEEKLVKQYGALSLYLLSCRIRGEYCCYSIVAEDGGLVSELNFLGGLKAEKWY